MGVSVNCEFTLICESESGADKEANESDEDVDESDGGAVDAESKGEVGVDVSDDEVEEEIAESEVVVDDEEMVELLSTDAAAEEEEDEAEDEGDPAPAGGSLSSVTSLSFRSKKKKNIQIPSQRKIVDIQINVFWILLDIPAILIGNFQCMFSIC